MLLVKMFIHFGFNIHLEFIIKQNFYKHFQFSKHFHNFIVILLSNINVFA
jgi:hypothetical protein